MSSEFEFISDRLITECYDVVRSKFIEQLDIDLKSTIKEYFNDILEHYAMPDIIIVALKNEKLKRSIIRRCTKITLSSERFKNLLKTRELMKKASDIESKKRKVDDSESINLIRKVERKVDHLADVFVSKGPKPLTEEQLKLDKELRYKYSGTRLRTSRNHMFEIKLRKQYNDKFTWRTISDMQFNRELPIGWELINEKDFLKPGEIMYKSGKEGDLYHIVDKYGYWTHFIKQWKNPNEYYYRQIDIAELRTFIN